MFASVRRVKTLPGQADQVAELIRTEYLPLLDGVEGFLGYTLVETGEDEVSSFGVFTNTESAEHANRVAHSWVSERLMPHIASPLEAETARVLVDHRT